MSKTDLLVRNISHIDGYSNGIAREALPEVSRPTGSSSAMKDLYGGSGAFFREERW